MKKALSYLTVFIIGIAISCSGYWFVTVKQHELQAYKTAVEEHEKLNDMHYLGGVVEVSPKSLLLQVFQKGGEEVQSEETINIEVTGETSIQEGMNFLDIPDGELDLTKFLEAGTIVNVLVDDGQALALHFDSLDATVEPKKQ